MGDRVSSHPKRDAFLRDWLVRGHDGENLSQTLALYNDDVDEDPDSARNPSSGGGDAG